MRLCRWSDSKLLHNIKFSVEKLLKALNPQNISSLDKFGCTFRVRWSVKSTKKNPIIDEASSFHYYLFDRARCQTHTINNHRWQHEMCRVPPNHRCSGSPGSDRSVLAKASRFEDTDWRGNGRLHEGGKEIARWLWWLRLPYRRKMCLAGEAHRRVWRVFVSQRMFRCRMWDGCLSLYYSWNGSLVIISRKGAMGWKEWKARTITFRINFRKRRQENPRTCYIDDRS